MGGQYLKCDAPGCDHREDIEQLTADMIGRECPKCGASLLTQSDFDKFSAPSAEMARLMRDFSAMPLPAPGDDAVRVEFGMENGEITLNLSMVTVPE